jgi:prepilin-type N-terminal cleavage/methylation domain-containing protein
MAFTLLEMVVVVVILAILATLIVPRLAGNERREFRLAVDRVGDLLTMYGQRRDLAQKVVGIVHYRGDNSLAILELDTSDPTAQADWRPDPYIKPVRLPSFMSDIDIEFVVDGNTYDASDWPLSTEPGQQRPTVEIHMRGADDFASLTLAPHGVSPVIVNGPNSSGIFREAFDLDGAGRGREDW